MDTMDTMNTMNTMENTAISIDKHDRDTNTNDVIELSIRVNGILYYKYNSLLNTQPDMATWRRKMIEVIGSMKLFHIANFKPRF